MIFVKDIVIGIVIGGGLVLPGVSGAVLAVIFGIYEKLTNDTLGYDAGDEGIFTVSDVIKKHTRYCDRSMTDILLTEPKEHSWAFRYGGDEFVIILPNCTKEDAEKFVADRIKKSIKLAFKDSNIDFSISIGIVDTRDPNMYIPFSIADEELKAMYKSLIKKSSELMKIDKKASKDKRIAVMGALNRLGETLGINPYDNDELKILTDEMYRIGSEYNNKYSKNK
jgi:diguanylate cyclase (GGDEF)-like protein